MNLKVVNVWYRYSPNRIALKKISLALEDKITIIVGPNASGKTTLLKLMSLIYKPWKGRILINNRDYWRLSSRDQLSIRRKIIYVHEKPIIIRGTILDNILLGYKIRNMNSSKIKQTKKVSELLEIFNLSNTLNLKPRMLSTGQLQLLSIIRALVLEPELLLLDEPTANLDQDKRKVLLEYIEEYISKDSKRKVIIATHDLFIPLLLEDSYLIVLNNGEIVNKGYANEILGYEYKKLYNILKRTGMQI